MRGTIETFRSIIDRITPRCHENSLLPHECYFSHRRLCNASRRGFQPGISALHSGVCKRTRTVSNVTRNSPKVCQLEGAEALIDQNVIRLDIGMDQLPRGHVFQSRHELLRVFLYSMNVDSRLRPQQHHDRSINGSTGGRATINFSTGLQNASSHYSSSHQGSQSTGRATSSIPEPTKQHHNESAPNYTRMGNDKLGWKNGRWRYPHARIRRHTLSHEPTVQPRL